jgi:hypothetical protein
MEIVFFREGKYIGTFCSRNCELKYMEGKNGIGTNGDKVPEMQGSNESVLSER